MRNAMTADVVGCARCGGDHPAMTHRPFTRLNPVYSLWAICPATGEPILSRMVLDRPDGTVERLTPEQVEDFERAASLDTAPPAGDAGGGGG